VRAAEAKWWRLPLPRETRRYIPKLLALLQLIREPEDKSLYLATVPIRSPWVAVDTGGQLELARAAQLAGVDEAALRRMNGGHLRWATAPSAPHLLWLPEAAVASFSDGLSALPTDDRVRWQRYVIQPGDSLIRIAGQFDSDVGTLREVNGLSGNLIRAGDALLIPQGGTWSGRIELARRDARPASQPARYRVRRGDSLWTIARRYDLSVDRLEQWNNIPPGSYLQPGQTLRLRP
jgi:membrane-bound lytic murein transglycosylase D